MSTETLVMQQGDTWTFDLSVTGLPGLDGAAAGPFDLSGCTVQLAVAPGPLSLDWTIPASPDAVAGLARLVVPPSLTQAVKVGSHRLHLRLVSPGAVAFVATQAYTRLRVLPSLLPAAV